jgi:hypothetical protein
MGEQLFDEGATLASHSLAKRTAVEAWAIFLARRVADCVL